MDDEKPLSTLDQILARNLVADAEADYVLGEPRTRQKRRLIAHAARFLHDELILDVFHTPPVMMQSVQKATDALDLRDSQALARALREIHNRMLQTVIDELMDDHRQDERDANG